MKPGDVTTNSTVNSGNDNPSRILKGSVVSYVDYDHENLLVPPEYKYIGMFFG